MNNSFARNSLSWFRQKRSLFLTEHDIIQLNLLFCQLNFIFLNVGENPNFNLPNIINNIPKRHFFFKRK